MQDPLKRTTWLSLLGSVPLMPLLVLPVMVGAFVDDLGLGESAAGWLASMGFLGASGAALLLAFRIHRLDLRRIGFISLWIMLIADGTSTAAVLLPVELLALLRLVSGAAGAVLYGAVMGAFAGWREPDRAYGYFMAVQFAISGIGLYLLPSLIPEIGAAGLFGLFAVLDLLVLALVAHLPASAERKARLGEIELEWKVILTLTAFACLLAIGIFETAQMAQFTYIERVGVSLGLGAADIGLALGIASFLGIPAAFSVVLIGSRFGYFRPIALACTMEIGAVAMLLLADGFPDYLLAACLLGMGWAFVLPYFYAIEARIDPGGSVVVAGSFATGAAGFLGPAGGALLVRPGDYALMLWSVLAALAVVIALARIVTLRLANSRPVDP